MLRVEIPGWKDLEFENLALDMNGTMAIDGIIPTNVRKRISELAKTLSIYLLSADTHGTLEEQTTGLPAQVVRIRPKQEAEQKRDFTLKLRSDKTVAIGNGANDVLMLKEASLSILVLGSEGAVASAIQEADIIVPSAQDALDLLLKPSRLRASLRR